MVSKHCIPELKKSDNPHILTLSPPLNLNPEWFGRHTAYTMAKYGMSMTVIGLAEELRSAGVAVNALWPRTTIATAAIRNLIGGEEMMRRSRKPEIMADAAAEIISRPALNCSGNFFIDDEVLAEAGITDLSNYAVEPGMDLMDDLFLGEPQF
jgi:citronellol/citronellal dehydrogenase